MQEIMHAENIQCTKLNYENKISYPLSWSQTMLDNSKNRSQTTLPSLQWAVRNFPMDSQHLDI